MNGDCMRKVNYKWRAMLDIDQLRLAMDFELIESAERKYESMVNEVSNAKIPFASEAFVCVFRYDDNVSTYPTHVSTFIALFADKQCIVRVHSICAY